MGDFYEISPGNKKAIGLLHTNIINKIMPGVAQFTRCALAHVHNTCVVMTARLHDALCTYVFAEFASVFPPSLIYISNTWRHSF